MRQALVGYLLVTAKFFGGMALVLVVWWVVRNGDYVVGWWEEMVEQWQQAGVVQPKPVTGCEVRLGQVWRAPVGAVLAELPVRIGERELQGRGFQPMGMGFLIDGRHIVTAAHVVSLSGDYIWENEVWGWREVHDERLVADRDLMMMSVDEMVSVDQIVLSRALMVGESVWMMVGEGATMQHLAGEIVERDKDITLMTAWGEVKNEKIRVIAVRMSNTLGDSGSPVFNERDELVGVLVGVDLDDEGLTYVSPVCELTGVACMLGELRVSK